ncbi:MAG: methyltransferase domain-containing protein, partial [Cyanobacteriota bacterium]
MTVKLNIGCNKVYKAGYINIDETNDAIADRVSTPYDLPFEDNSVDLIESYNLIEQLTFEKALMSIEEWYRVLKNGGRLVIETLHLDNIVEEYLKTDEHEYKDEYLKKVFKTNDENNQVYSAYNIVKLTHILLSSGFENVEELTPKVTNYKEGFRLECIKPDDNLINLIVIKIRKKAFKELDSICFNDTKVFWEFDGAIVELLIKPILNKIVYLKPSQNEDFYKLVTYSPKLALIFINTCLEYKIIDNNEHINIFKVLDIFIKNK